MKKLLLLLIFVVMMFSGLKINAEEVIPEDPTEPEEVVGGEEFESNESDNVENLGSETYTFIDEVQGTSYLTINNDGTYSIKVISLEGVDLGTVEGVWQPHEEHIDLVFLEEALCIVLNEETKTFGEYILEEPPEEIEEKNPTFEELKEWFEIEVMPFITSALGSLLGSGILTAILAFVFKKIKSKIDEEVKKVLNNAGATTDQANSVIKALDTKFNEVEKKSLDLVQQVSNKANDSINAAIKEMKANSAKSTSDLNNAKDQLAESTKKMDEYVSNYEKYQERHLKIAQNLVASLQTLESEFNDENKD